MLTTLEGRKTLLAILAGALAKWLETRWGLQLPPEVWAAIIALGAWGLNDKANRAISAMATAQDPGPKTGLTTAKEALTQEQRTVLKAVMPQLAKELGVE